MILMRPAGTVLMSAEVPPMSTVMTLSAPARSPSARPPMTPPAGPDMRMLTARFEHASTVETPPFDWMSRRFARNPWRASWSRRLVRYTVVLGPMNAFIAAVEKRSYSRRTFATSEEQQT